MTALPLVAQRARLIDANRREYGSSYASLPFPTPVEGQRRLAERNRLLQALAGRVETGCSGAKLDMRRLSPGCRICAAGHWSCLFINGRCNAQCFYCPARQEETGLPTTQTLAFRSPADYVAYLKTFGFQGMSLSGGEPLLTPGRSLAFLAAAKQHFGNRLHAWLYTNGKLVTRELLLRLRDAGLDEIRFDIGAVGYSLSKLRLAVGLIPTVTVEIPAVPEETADLKQKMLEMAAIGVQHLNLHQLRVTPYSVSRFSGRPYTYLHGEKVTVLESELAALELVHYGVESVPELPVNYCSFVFKHRYQQAAARRRGAGFLQKPHEDVTRAGFLRTLALIGPEERLAGLERTLRALPAVAPLWQLQKSRQRISFAARLWPALDVTGLSLVVSYADTHLHEAASGRHPFREFRLPSGRKIVVEWNTVDEFVLDGAAMNVFAEYCCQARASAPSEWSDCVADLRDLRIYEQLPEGWADYY